MLIDQEALQEFIDESLEALETAEGDFIRLEKEPDNAEIINAIFRPIHSLKGSSGFFGLTNINKFAHRLENLLDQVRKGELSLSREIVDILLQGIEALEQMLLRIRQDAAATAFLPAEEKLLALIENYRPAPAGGSIRTLVEMQQLLQEAADQGVDIYAQSPVSDLLNRLERAKAGIATLLRDLAANRTPDDFAVNAGYFYRDLELTPHALLLIEARTALLGRKTLAPSRLKALGEAISRLQELLPEPELREQVGRLAAMANFMDDQTLISNPEFSAGACSHIEQILAAFCVKSDDPAAVGEGRLGDILVAQCKISPTQLNVALSKQQKLGEILLAEGAITPGDLQQAVEQQTSKIAGGTGAKAESAADKTIRISQSKIDKFAEAIGELFINLDSFNYLKKQMEMEDTPYELMAKFTGTVGTFDDMVSELHNSVMEIRKVPFNTMVQRFPKVVRQLAASVTKEIDLVIRGEETVIDKDLIEKLENPLVHILRNSIDHGIETPQQRLAMGKKRQGLIELAARIDEDFVYISIIDDGAGINPEKMKQVALKKGVASAEELEKYSDNQLINLIFAPGFSSAEQVSDISGRGVGMDVVLSGLRACNGEINVSATVNQGTTIAIKIPLTKTLVTKDAMIIRVADHLFAIDSREIDTTLEANLRINEPAGQQRSIQVNGKPHRVIDLHGCFFPDEQALATTGQAAKVFIVSESLRLALLVDQVLSHQKIVVKDFRKSYVKLRTIGGISGYSILGNQDIALIIDLAGLSEHI